MDEKTKKIYEKSKVPDSSIDMNGEEKRDWDGINPSSFSITSDGNAKKLIEDYGNGVGSSDPNSIIYSDSGLGISSTNFNVVVSDETHEYKLNLKDLEEDN